MDMSLAGATPGVEHVIDPYLEKCVVMFNFAIRFLPRRLVGRKGGTVAASHV